MTRITHRLESNEAAIHRLVDDILTSIFLLNATVPDPDGCEHATTVASSQVCMRWRSIALNCHTIWAPIIDYSRHSLKWIETLLDRSYSSPLDFGSRIAPVDTVHLLDDGQGVLELVFNHIDRLRTFNLKVLESCWDLVCLRFLQLPAPHLEFVKIYIIFSDYNVGQGRRFRPDFGVAKGFAQLMHPLFNHHAPNLQNLQLPRCIVDFTSPILTHLTELDVRDIAHSSAAPTVLDWLNILGGMPSLRWVTLIRAISSSMTNAIYPIIQLAALEMLSVDDEFREIVTMIEHLITPPRCGLKLVCDNSHVGFDQRKLWAVIEKKMDSWAINAPNRYLGVWVTQTIFSFGNLPRGLEMTWYSEAETIHHKQHIHLLDPVMTVTLHLLNPHDTFPALLSLFAIFERTFFDTTHLKLCIDVGPDSGSEMFLPLVDMFRGFVNLKEMYLGYDSLMLSFLPLLQRSLPNSVFLPALQSLDFYNTNFRHPFDSLPRVADFLRWRGEQGFPVQKIHVANHGFYKQYLLNLIQAQDTVLEIDDSNYSDAY